MFDKYWECAWDRKGAHFQRENPIYPHLHLCHYCARPMVKIVSVNRPGTGEGWQCMNCGCTWSFQDVLEMYKVLRANPWHYLHKYTTTKKLGMLWFRRNTGIEQENKGLDKQGIMV